MALRSILKQIANRKGAAIPQISILNKTYCKEMSEKVSIIDFETLHSKMKSGTILVDVREPSELTDDGKIPNSVNIPLGQITEAFNMSNSSFLAKYGVPKPDKETNPFVVSCRSGKRATDAFQRLHALGYSNALVYSGSFQDWVKNGGAVEK